MITIAENAKGYGMKHFIPNRSIVEAERQNMRDRVVGWAGTNSLIFYANYVQMSYTYRHALLIK